METRKYSDQQLLTDLHLGRESALEEINKRYLTALYLFATKILRESHRAEDAIQEAMLLFWKSRESYNSVDHLRNSMFLILKNKCLDYNKQYVVSGLDISVSEPIMDEHSAVTWKLANAEVIAQVHKAVAKMPPKLQMVFFLTFENDLSLEEIAQALQISKQHLKNQKTAAFSILREYLRQNCDAMALLTKAFSF